MNSSTLIKNLTLASLGILVTVSASAFAQNNFTDVPTPLDSSNPSYPLSRSNALQGGHHQVQSVTDMYNIPVSRLTKGMLVYVVSSDATYRLMTSPSANPTSASDRVLVKSLSYGSGAGGGGSGDTTINVSGDSLWMTDGTHIYNSNLGYGNIGIGTSTPVSTLTVYGSLSILRGTPLSIPVYAPITRNITSIVSSEVTSPSGMNCSCDTGVGNQCNIGQTVSNGGTQCYDFVYDEIIGSECTTIPPGWIDNGQGQERFPGDYQCVDIKEYYYNIYNVGTQGGQLLSTIFKDMSYITISTGTNIIEIGTTSGSQSITTGGYTVSASFPGTKTIIRGDLEIKDAGLNLNRDTPRSTLTVESNGLVRRSIVDKPGYSDFYSTNRTYRLSFLNNVGFSGTQAGGGSFNTPGRLKMMNSKEGFCFLTTVGLDTNSNIGGNEEHRFRVWVDIKSDGFWYLNGSQETDFNYEGGATCIRYP